MMKHMCMKHDMQEGAKVTSMFSHHLEEYGIRNIRARNDYLTQHDFKNALVVWAFQFCLCFYVVARDEAELREIYKEQLKPEYGITRLITQIVMHVLMQKEFEQALNMMKYSANHPWKFRNVSLAFFTGFMQLTISLIIELSNIYIVLANGESQFEIIANFIIMLVIADFDNYFYNARSSINKIITDDRYASIFTWEVTSSYDGAAKIP